MLTLYLSMLDNEQERKKMTDLYKEHKYVLLRYAIKITCNQSMAEDAVHNAFISIIEKKEKYLKLDCMYFRRSAVIIVRNKCIDILRKQKPFANKSIEELEIFLESDEVPVDEQIDFIPPNEQLAKIYSFSPEFEVRMKKLFAKNRRKDFAKAIMLYSRKIGL
nr:sigma factor [Tissierella praeacuta]